MPIGALVEINLLTELAKIFKINFEMTKNRKIANFGFFVYIFVPNFMRN